MTSKTTSVDRLIAAEHPAPASKQLADWIGQAFIIAYRESTQLLEETLTGEGFQCEVLRQEDQAELQSFSRAYRCMMNHRQAWERASQQAKPTLIVEADFVPVLGLGNLPLPFNPHRDDTGIAWLYTCAPQLYSVSQEGYAEGYSTSAVAYIVTPRSASDLLTFAAQVDAQQGTAYSTWDSDLDKFLRAQHLRNYIPFRNYGEHGGRPNPEHRQNKMSGIHQADVLYGKLAFRPLYVSDQGGQLELLSTRLKARLKGIARLLSGRFVRVKILVNSSVSLRLLSFATRRHLSLRL